MASACVLSAVQDTDADQAASKQKAQTKGPGNRCEASKWMSFERKTLVCNELVCEKGCLSFHELPIADGQKSVEAGS